MNYSDKNILAIDCAGAEMKVGLRFGGDRMVKASVEASRAHSALIMRSIQSIMESAGCSVKDLNAIVVCTGPGSFTGLRIGIACAKGMAVGLGIPVVGVNLFELAAYKLKNESEAVKVLVPFKKGSYFLAEVKRGAADLSNILAIEEKDLERHLNGSVAAVMGRDYKEEFLSNTRLVDRSRTNYDATELIYLGIEKLNRNEVEDLAKLEPLYVQKSQAEIRFEERQSGKN
jgi:tRNA threonylcarbamoyladenosine biosynthesis protein TsaB